MHLPRPPPNYLWQSIVVTVFLCLPFGVVGIVYASKDDRLYRAGRVEEAYSASKQAKIWAIAGLCTGIFIWILFYVCAVAHASPKELEELYHLQTCC